MALWRIVVKNSGNAACKDKRQRLEKGMFIETSTVSPIPPIGVARERPMLAQLFLNKYGYGIRVPGTIVIRDSSRKLTDLQIICKFVRISKRSDKNGRIF